MMSENTSGTSNLLDTTDCLEAVGVFRGWKNFFFIILLLCILLLQACFWLTDLNMIQVPQEMNGTFGFSVSINPGAEMNAIPDNDNNQLINEPNEAAEPEVIPADIEPNVSTGVSDSNQTDNTDGIIKLAATETISTPNNPSDINDMSDEEEAGSGIFTSIKFDYVVWAMRLANAILIITSVLYCMTMLFSLKISMLGRLGGINHITRAFFLSLLLLVLVLPWQKVFDGVIIGALFTSSELIQGHAEKTSDLLDMVLYYMRFSGYMVLVFLLLILAQLRSGRWAKAILRRLEII